MPSTTLSNAMWATGTQGLDQTLQAGGGPGESTAYPPFHKSVILYSNTTSFVNYNILGTFGGSDLQV